MVYEPNWTAGKLKRAPRQKEAADKRFRLFSHRHAMAIFDKEKVRHAWLVNFEGHAAQDYKVDRRPTIAAVEQEGRDLFNVRVQLGRDERRTLVLNVVHLLYGKAPRVTLRPPG